MTGLISCRCTIINNIVTGRSDITWIIGLNLIIRKKNKFCIRRN